jgi:cation diffusion facilitator CzcD-associated flavoprotein CzcO
VAYPTAAIIGAGSSGIAAATVERFDALLVANGHHWDPRWPEPMFPGHETFAGTQIHAHDYRDSDIFAGRARARAAGFPLPVPARADAEAEAEAGNEVAA